jgi:hypothetical protein
VTDDIVIYERTLSQVFFEENVTSDQLSGTIRRAHHTDAEAEAEERA